MACDLLTPTAVFAALPAVAGAPAVRRRRHPPRLCRLTVDISTARRHTRGVSIDFTGPPARVYAQITELDEDAFALLMAEQETRDRVIDVLVQHMAALYKGDPQVDAVIHVKLWDRPGGGYDHRELVIADGVCTASETPTHDPRLTLKIRPTDLRRIVTGDAGPKRLAFQRRLTVLGDVRFGMKLSDLFDL